MSAFLSALLTALFALTSPVDLADALKCGGMTFPGVPEGEVLIALDDRIVGGDDEARFSLSEANESVGIGFIDLTCWNAETGRFGKDLRGHYPLIMVLTSPRVDGVVEPLRRLARAQFDHHEAIGEYAQSLEALADPELTIDGLRFAYADGGWEASLENDWVRCEVRLSEIEGRDPPLATPVCETTNPGLSQALRDYLAEHNKGVRFGPLGDD